MQRVPPLVPQWCLLLDASLWIVYESELLFGGLDSDLDTRQCIHGSVVQHPALRALSAGYTRSILRPDSLIAEFDYLPRMQAGETALLRMCSKL